MIIRRIVLIAMLILSAVAAEGLAGPLRIATFEIDVTPPLGAPLCDGLVPPAASVDDPLSCRGIVILGAGEPIVLCALDWVGIGNGGYQAWREALAAAAGTSPSRVAVHATHAHDAPGCDFDTEKLLAEHDLSGAAFDVMFARQTMERAAVALKEAIDRAQPVTHIGAAKAAVEQFASNRRVIGSDGKVKYWRGSATRDADARAEPEGIIDPHVYLVGFWSGETPLAALSYYACHPQSHYGKGVVSCDTVGLARNINEHHSGVRQIHFNGAGGNVAAGKYNDGSPANRDLLARRLAVGMERAWASMSRRPIRATDVDWRLVSVALAPSPSLSAPDLLAVLRDASKPLKHRVQAARDLIWLRRSQRGDKVDLTCLSLGPVRIVHMPGELFVEYQLAAAKMRPDLFVAMAAYGDYGMGYIGTAAAYPQGGYEVNHGISLVAPEVEDVLMTAMRELLK